MTISPISIDSLLEPVVPYRISVYAGAGSSADSGIPVFQNNLWNDHDVNIVCNIANLKKNAHIVNHFYHDYAKMEKKHDPNSFHRWLGDQKSRGIPIQVTTTNIDTMFERSGISDVLHIHGTPHMQHCYYGCNLTWTPLARINIGIPTCPRCFAKITKPAVTFYGETCENYEVARNRLRSNDQVETLLIDLGSSHRVFSDAVTAITSCKQAYKVLWNPDKQLIRKIGARYDICINNTVLGGFSNFEDLVSQFIQRRSK